MESGTQVSTSLAAIDSEIARVTAEIAKIHAQAEYQIPPVSTDSLTYNDLPDIQNIYIPSGYERAPMTFPYNPSKLKKLAEMGNDLKDVLKCKRDEDIAILVRQIHRHQCMNPIRLKGEEVTPSNKFKQTSIRPQSSSILKFLIPQSRI
jgi:uncharacterized small protein (DUF1192 family)